MVHARQRQAEGKPEGYHEKHHIVPKALGGPKMAFNLVYLTPKEHYISHHLLTKFTEGSHRRSMVHAWNLMCHCDKTSKRYVPAVQYEHLRRELAKAGKSPEHRAKIGATRVGKKRAPFTKEAKKAMSEARKKDWAEGKYTNNHLKGPKSEKWKASMTKTRNEKRWSTKKKDAC